MHIRQKKLLDFLRAKERTGQPFTPEDAEEASGYTEGTVRTYIAKGLLGPWIIKTPNASTYKAKGVIGISPQQFASAMSQNSGRGFRDARDWELQVRRLIGMGRDLGYPAEQLLEQILSTLRRRRSE